MINRKKFFDGIRSMPFPGKLTKRQVEGMEAILAEWEERDLSDNLKWLAYILATAKWETNHTMQPIKELGSSAYLRGKKYWPWIGRGFVQLTWKYNYEKYHDVVLRTFDVDIIKDPDAAMRMDVASYIIIDGMIGGVFTGKGLKTYTDKEGNLDWIQARRVVNGLDRATEIAGIAKQFYADLINSEESS